MRTLAVIGCLAGLMVGTACVTLAHFLTNLALAVERGLDISTLVDGRLHFWFFAPEVWSQSSLTPTLGGLINVGAGAVMLAIACAVVYATRHRLRRSPAVVGLICLLVSAIPYAVGALALSTNTEPMVAGPWIHFMLCSLIYGSALCFLFGIAQFVARRSAIGTGSKGQLQVFPPSPSLNPL